MHFGGEWTFGWQEIGTSPVYQMKTICRKSTHNMVNIHEI
jgi:K+ transporter